VKSALKNDEVRKACINAFNVMIHRGDFPDYLAYDFREIAGRLYMVIWDPRFPDPKAAYVDAKEIAASVDPKNRPWDSQPIIKGNIFS
jgi:hypothetical protein